MTEEARSGSVKRPLQNSLLIKVPNKCVLTLPGVSSRRYLWMVLGSVFLKARHPPSPEDKLYFCAYAICLNLTGFRYDDWLIMISPYRKENTYFERLRETDLNAQK